MESRRNFSLKSKKSLFALILAVVLIVLFIIILIPSSPQKITKEQTLQIQITDQIALLKKQIVNNQKELESLKNCNRFLTVLTIINFILLLLVFFFRKKKADKKEKSKELSEKEAVTPTAPKIENPSDEKE